MRMWLGVEPEQLCRNHLLGEHNEIHKAIGNLKHSGTWAKSLIYKGYLEPKSFKQRHDALAKEMINRGYAHNSPIADFEPNGFSDFRIDPMQSLNDLINRCEKCKENIVGGENFEKNK